MAATWTNVFTASGSSSVQSGNFDYHDRYYAWGESGGHFEVREMFDWNEVVFADEIDDDRVGWVDFHPSGDFVSCNTNNDGIRHFWLPEADGEDAFDELEDANIDESDAPTQYGQFEYSLDGEYILFPGGHETQRDPEVRTVAGDETWPTTVQITNNTGHDVYATTFLRDEYMIWATRQGTIVLHEYETWSELDRITTSDDYRRIAAPEEDRMEQPVFVVGSDGGQHRLVRIDEDENLEIVKSYGEGVTTAGESATISHRGDYIFLSDFEGPHSVAEGLPRHDVRQTLGEPASVRGSNFSRNDDFLILGDSENNDVNIFEVPDETRWVEGFVMDEAENFVEDARVFGVQNDDHGDSWVRGHDDTNFDGEFEIEFFRDDEAHLVMEFWDDDFDDEEDYEQFVASAQPYIHVDPED